MFASTGTQQVLASDEVAIPALTSPVTDLTHTLTPDQASSLESKLRAFEQSKGSQVAVLMVATTKPEDVEQYSIRVVDAWKLGRKNVDDGILLIIAKDDHAVRIEVGKGLEGVLPDVTASRIIRNVIIPQFRSGQFYAGINEATDQIIKVINGEALPEPARTQTRSHGFNGNWFYLVIAAIVVGQLLRSIFGRFLGGMIAGGVVGFIIWWGAGVLLFAIVGALFAFIAVISNGRGSGWGGFGGGGGWSSGGGGGGGGWSGGGGGFSGGGASGRW